MFQQARRFRTALVAASVLLAFGSAAAASARYALTDLGASTSASSINGSGQVAGQDAEGHAAVWRAGAWTPLQSPADGSFEDPTTLRINGTGAVASNCASASSVYRAILWSPTGTLQSLFGSLNIASVATDMADDGTVVGYASNAQGGDPYAYIWKSGVARRLPVAPWGTQVTPQAVSSNHLIAGVSTTPEQREELVIYQNGAWHDLGSLGGAVYVAHMNRRGHIVGMATTDSGVLHAFAWQGTSIADLGTLGGLSSAARSINRRGTIVGWSQVPAGTVDAFVQAGGTMQDLNDGLVSGATGWSFTTANDVNDSGVIVGNGMLDGVPHAFMLTPTTR
jgi:probable HAF family extracellular repeat protein